MYHGIEQIFSKRYKIIKIIGQGGMGKIYLAVTNDRLVQYRAIKEIDCTHTVGQDVLHEARILKELEHDGIPRIIEIKETKEKVYIIQEFIEGVSLKEIIMGSYKVKQKMILQWLIQLVDILEYIHHKKIIHRDIKPHNIMLTKEGKIKLIDFGISTNGLVEVNQGHTPIYAAPEQLNKQYSDERSDIYSLGITLCYLLTKEVPKTDEIKSCYVYYPHLNQEKLGAGIVHIIKKTTQLLPAKRYSNITELKKDIAKLHKFDKAYIRQRWFVDMQIGLILLLFIISSICLLGGIKQLKIEKNDRYTDLCSINTELVTSKRYEEAITGFETAIELIPNKIQAYRGIANAYYQQYQYEQCVTYISNILTTIEDASSDGKLNYLLGTAYFELGDYLKAVHYIERAYKTDKNNEDYIRDLGVSYARNRNLNKAEEFLRYIEDDGFSRGVSYYVMGEISKAKKKSAQAYTYFEKSIEISDNEEVKKKAYIELGNLLKNNPQDFKQSRKQAVHVLEEAMSTLKDKNSIPILEMLGEAYYNYANELPDSEKHNESLRKATYYFSQILSLGYERDYLYKNISIIYQELGEYERGEETLQTMIRQYPDNPLGQLQLVWLYLQMEQDKPKEKRNYDNTVKAFHTLRLRYDIKDNTDYQVLQQKMIELVEKRWITEEELGV